MDNKKLLDIFKVLSNETRLNILLWLKNPGECFPPQGEHLDEGIDLKGGVCGNSICEKSGIAQSTVSHYLDMMVRADLLLTERYGKWTYFRRNEQVLNQLKEYIGKEL